MTPTQYGDALDSALAEIARLNAEIERLRAALAAPQRPLTEEEIKALMYDANGVSLPLADFARVIERAHGIGIKT